MSVTFKLSILPLCTCTIGKYGKKITRKQEKIGSGKSQGCSALLEAFIAVNFALKSATGSDDSVASSWIEGVSLYYGEIVLYQKHGETLRVQSSAIIC